MCIIAIAFHFERSTSNQRGKNKFKIRNQKPYITHLVPTTIFKIGIVKILFYIVRCVIYPVVQTEIFLEFGIAICIPFKSISTQWERPLSGGLGDFPEVVRAGWHSSHAGAAGNVNIRESLQGSNSTAGSLRFLMKIGTCTGVQKTYEWPFFHFYLSGVGTGCQTYMCAQLPGELF